jgi:DNA primase
MATLEKVLDNLHLIGVKTMNDQLMACCPFHNERRPSWAISIEKDQHPWVCYACGERGTVVTLVSRVKDVSITEAVRYLIDYDPMFGQLDLDEMVVTRFEDRHEKKQEFSVPEEAIYQFDNKIHKSITKRGFDVEFLQKFGVRWDPRLRRVVFPVRNIHGGLVGFCGRAVHSDQEPKYHFYKFPKMGYLYGAHELTNRRPLIIVEGPTDYLRVRQFGYRDVVALLGASCSENQAHLITELCGEAIIMLDNPDVDPAGRAGARRIVKMIGDKVRLYQLSYPRGVKDPGDLTKDQFSEMLRGKYIVGMAIPRRA